MVGIMQLQLLERDKKIIMGGIGQNMLREMAEEGHNNDSYSGSIVIYEQDYDLVNIIDIIDFYLLDNFIEYYGNLLIGRFKHATSIIDYKHDVEMCSVSYLLEFDYSDNDVEDIKREWMGFNYVKFNEKNNFLR